VSEVVLNIESLIEKLTSALNQISAIHLWQDAGLKLVSDGTLGRADHLFPESLKEKCRPIAGAVNV
jgi:hypothetical protein